MTQATTGKTGRVQRKKERAMAAIVESAEEQFLRQGYVGTTLEAIAGGADVGVGTIYSYYGGKDDLFMAVIERGLDLLEAYQEEVFTSGLTPRRQLVVLGETYLRFASEHQRHFRLLVGIGQQMDGNSKDERTLQRKARLDGRVAGLIGRIAEVIRLLLEEGDTNGLNADQLALFLWGSWNGVIVLYLQDDVDRFDAAGAKITLEQGRRLLIAGMQAILEDGAKGEW
jgi:TetR/AcrR family transcriptional regulator